MLFIVNLRPLPKIPAWGGVVNHTIFSNLRPLPKIQAWGGVVNAIYSKFTTPPQNPSLGRGRKCYF